MKCVLVSKFIQMKVSHEIQGGIGIEDRIDFCTKNGHCTILHMSVNAMTSPTAVLSVLYW